MGLNWSEDELRLKGYTKGSDGVYRRPGKEGPNINSKSREQSCSIQIDRDKDSGEMPESEQSVCFKKKRGDGTKKRTERVSAEGNQFTIIIDSYRKRDMDPDNLCPKWYIDEIVGAGIIPDDLSVYVREVRKRVHKVKDEEYTKITIIKWLP